MMIEPQHLAVAAKFCTPLVDHKVETPLPSTCKRPDNVLQVADSEPLI